MHCLCPESYNEVPSYLYEQKVNWEVKKRGDFQCMIQHPKGHLLFHDKSHLKKFLGVSYASQELPKG